MITTAAPLIARHRVQATNPAMLMAGAYAVVDLVALSVAVLAGFRLWLLVNPEIPPNPPSMWLAVGLSFAALAFCGLYPGLGMTAVEHMRRVCRSVTLVYLVLAASMFMVKAWWADSRGGFLLSWALSLAFVPLGRWIASKYFGERHWWGTPVVILGAGQTARMVIRNLSANQILGYRPVVCLDDDPDKRGDCLGIPVPDGLAGARYYAEVCRAKCAIVAMPGLPREELVKRLEEWSRIFPKIVIVPNLFGVASLWTAPRDLGGVLGLEIRCNLLNPLNQATKRLIDVIVSAVGLTTGAFLFVVAAVWIKRASPGPVLFSQEREGRHGRRIRVLKLRTMYLNAEETLQPYLARNPDAHQEWARFCKLKWDPRVIPGIGTFLRKTSLDELPQLWNVLRGEMSLVGPRPFPRYHNQRFEPDFQLLRLRVTPGLTGLWQVAARSNGDLDAQMSLDSYYIRNWSLWLDAYILVRTIRVVLARDGAC
jgi:Undecaprenyl-phosphate galactose phosphotransferase WbaP